MLGGDSLICLIYPALPPLHQGAAEEVPVWAEEEPCWAEEEEEELERFRR